MKQPAARLGIAASLVCSVLFTGIDHRPAAATTKATRTGVPELLKRPAHTVKQSTQAVDLQAGIGAIHAPKNHGRLSYSNAQTFDTSNRLRWVRLDVNPQFTDLRTIHSSTVTLDNRWDRKEGAWSPDSKRFAYFVFDAAVNDWTLRYLHVQTYYALESQTRTVKSNGGSVRGRDPSWSPDGRHLYFVDQNGDVRRLDMTDIYSNAVTSATPELIYDSPTRARFPRVSPDGTRIAFSEAKAADTPNNRVIRVMDIDGTNVRDLSTNAAQDDMQPTWSPDMNTIVFSRWDPRCVFTTTLPGARYDLYSIPAGGGAETRLTFVAAQDQTNDCNHSAEEAIYSPDGSELFFSTTNPDNTVWSPADAPSDVALKYSIYRMAPAQRAAMREIESVTSISRRSATQHFPQIRPVVVTGRVLTYTVVARNRSATDAASVSLKGTIPDDTKYLSHTAPPGWTCQTTTQTPVSVTCNGSTLAAGSIVSFPIRVEVLTTTQFGHIITATAEVSTDSGDTSPDNNTAEIVRQVVSPDPILRTKLGTIAGACPTSTTYITVTFRTPVTYCYETDPNTNATVILAKGINDRYDAADKLIEERSWRPIEDPYPVILPPSPLLLIQTFSEEPPEERRHHNAARLELFDAFGTYTPTAYVTEVVLFNADVKIEITTTARTVKPRQPVTFTITVTNGGPDDPVISTILSLPGFTNIKASTSTIINANKCAAAVGIQVSCRLGTMIASSSQRITLTANAPAANGPQTATASVAGNGLEDLEPQDNSATAVIRVDGPGLQVFLPLMRR